MAERSLVSIMTNAYEQVDTTENPEEKTAMPIPGWEPKVALEQ